MNTVSALGLAATVGPYFAVQVGMDDGPWRPFDELLDAAVLNANVDVVTAALSARAGVAPAELDRRACASTYFLGLASRLIAPALGAASLAAHVPRFERGSLAWQQVDSGPLPLCISGVTGIDVDDPAAAATALHTGVIDTVIAPLAAAFETPFALSPQIVWGNVASAVAGAATVLRLSGVPARVAPGALAKAVTSRGALEGMGAWTSTGFVRHNCCLFYKLPGAGTCGDCVLTATTRE